MTGLVKDGDRVSKEQVTNASAVVLGLVALGKAFEKGGLSGAMTVLAEQPALLTLLLVGFVGLQGWFRRRNRAGAMRAAAEDVVAERVGA